MQPISFRCPHCDQALKIGADKSGRKVKCKRCLEIVTVPDLSDAEEDDRTPSTERPASRKLRSSESEPDTAPLAPPTEAEEEEAPKRRRRRPRRSRIANEQGWTVVRVGLIVLLIGIAIEAIYSLWSSLALLVRLPSTFDFLVLNPFLVQIILKSVLAAGFLLCSFAPARTESLPAAIGCVISLLVLGGLPLYHWLTTPSAAEIEQQVKQAIEMTKLPPMPKENNKEAREKWLKDVQTHSEKSMEQMLTNAKRSRRSTAIIGILSMLFQGAYLLCVPILLRGFALALERNEIERLCDTLLKLSAALLALVVSRTVLFTFLSFFLILNVPIAFAGSIVELAWLAVFAMILVQLWQALGERN